MVLNKFFLVEKISKFSGLSQVHKSRNFFLFFSGTI